MASTPQLEPTARPGALGRISRTLLIVVVIAIGGYEAAVPGVGRAERVQLVYGVFVSNAVLIAYITLLMLSGGLWRLRGTLRENRVVNYALLIVLLGMLGILSAGVNQTSILDVGQAARLFMLAAYFVLLVHWARLRGATFVLRVYLIGLICGGLINLYYTFMYPQQVVVDVLPILYLANGSGGSLGMGIGFGALLWIMHETRTDRRVAVTIAIIGTIAVSLSFSKTAMLIGAFGLTAWAAVIARAAARRGWMPAIRRVAFATIAIAAVSSPLGLRAYDLVSTAVWMKFRQITVEQNFGLDSYYGTGSRYAYWPMTGKILLEHPVAGVGYGGLYDAYEWARADYDTIALREIEQARTTNPHNSFLYFVGANGIPGLIVVVLLFGKSMFVLLRCCARAGLLGRLVWVGLSLQYLVYASTLATLFNTEVLYLPVAAALAARLRQENHDRG